VQNSISAFFLHTHQVNEKITSFSNDEENVNSAPILLFHLQSMMVADQKIINAITVVTVCQGTVEYLNLIVVYS